MNIDELPTMASTIIDLPRRAKVSIKHHPQRETIIAIAKALYVLEDERLRDGKTARDYLMTAKGLVESTTIEVRLHIAPLTTPVAPDALSSAVHPVAPLPDKPTHAEVPNIPVKPAVIPTTAISVPLVTASIPHSAIHKGTKPTRIYSKVPHSCTRDLLPFRLNFNLLKSAIENSILAVTGGPLPDHTKLLRTYWSSNGQFIILQFRTPLNDDDHMMFHKVFSHFYDQEVSINDFIRKNITSSVKWTSIPRFNAQHEPVSCETLMEHLKSHPRFGKLHFVALPDFITGMNKSQDLYGTVKAVFRDDANGTALATVLNKTVLLNGQYRRTLPWVIKPAVQQCSNCL